MSPNEFQLRQALQDGEGDAPDTDRVIAHALGVRRERRRRINTIAGGTAAAAVVGLCASVFILAGGGSTGGGSGGSGDVAARNLPAAAGPTGATGPTSAAGPAGPVGGALPTANPPSGAANAQTHASCPTAADHYALPGGGGLGQFGSTEKLFPDDVTSLQVCTYSLQASAGPGTSSLVGADAHSVISALEAAPSVRSNGKCPANVNYVGATIELFGITSTGAKTPGVVITLGCSLSEATNGTAVRYPTELPQQLLTQLLPAPPAKSTAGGSPGTMHGSPVK